MKARKPLHKAISSNLHQEPCLARPSVGPLPSPNPEGARCSFCRVSSTLRLWQVLHNLALLAQTPYPAIGFPQAQKESQVSAPYSPTSSQPQQGSPGRGTLPRTPSCTLPVWEHPGDHPLLVHGPGDVVGDEAGLLHGIDEVSRGLQHRVVV